MSQTMVTVKKGIKNVKKMLPLVKAGELFSDVAYTKHRCQRSIENNPTDPERALAKEKAK
jgi:hypothetical protein